LRQTITKKELFNSQNSAFKFRLCVHHGVPYLFARKTTSNKIHEYFDTAYSQWNIRDFLDKCDLEPLGQKTDCYVRCLKTIANRETDRRREKAQELLDRYTKASISFF
jgi:hypothetical protein